MIIRASLMIVSATLLSAVVGGAESVDDIIAKNIEARGGLSRIKAIRTIRQSGQVRVEELRAAFVQENKRPAEGSASGRVREEFTIQGLTQVRAFDGKTAWQVNPMAGRRDPELLSEDDSKPLVEAADIEGQLVHYKEKGYQAELVGHDTVEGTDCYKIKLTLKNGDVRYYYLDTDSFLPLKLETHTTIRGTIQEIET